MSSRRLFTPHPVLAGADITASPVSDITIIQTLSLVSYSFSWAGNAPSASIDVQVSNDYSEDAEGQVKFPGTWSSLPLSTTPVISGNSGSGFIDIDANAGYALRVVITSISGTGFVNCFVTGKVA